MTVIQLNKLTRELIEQGHWNTEVAVDTNTFFEGDDGETIVTVEEGKIEAVKYGGLMDEKENPCTENFLVLRGNG